MTDKKAFDVSDEERNAIYEAAWEKGELVTLMQQFTDILIDEKANDTASEFVRNKIRATVKDAETAEALCPKSFPIGTKRACLDSGYYETFNEDHVSLVDLRKSPIETITETGVQTSHALLEFDTIVFATGFDAMTGALLNVDIQGRDGLSLKTKWEEGTRAYLGLAAASFPNLFMITGPGSPSVMSNMMVSIEQHVDWISDCLEYARQHDTPTIEATQTAEDEWVQHVNDIANFTLFPRANSWYMGANVPGKPRLFMPYIGGVGPYRQKCDEVAADDYAGFEFGGPQPQQVAATG